MASGSYHTLYKIQGMISDLSASYGAILLDRIYNHGTSYPTILVCVLFGPMPSYFNYSVALYNCVHFSGQCAIIVFWAVSDSCTSTHWLSIRVSKKQQNVHTSCLINIVYDMLAYSSICATWPSWLGVAWERCSSWSSVSAMFVPFRVPIGSFCVLFGYSVAAFITSTSLLCLAAAQGHDWLLRQHILNMHRLQLQWRTSHT